jgi:hypothetical protein
MNDEELLKRTNKCLDSVHNFDIAPINTYEIGTVLFEIKARLLEKMLDESQPELTSIVWEPETGDRYYFLHSDGVVLRGVWDDCPTDKARLKHHNVYKTREQAEKAAQYQKRYNMVLQAVLNLEPTQVVDWSDKDQAKHGVGFDRKEGVWWSSAWFSVEHLYPPLTDENNVQPLLDYLNATEVSDER